MECLNAKEKIKDTVKEFTVVFNEQKKSKAVRQEAINSFLDKLSGFRTHISDKVEKLNFLCGKLQELSWFQNMDNECIEMMRQLLDLSKEYHNGLIKYYVSLNWVIKFTPDVMKDFKHAINDLKEHNQDLHDLFFEFRNNDEFKADTNVLENL